MDHRSMNHHNHLIALLIFLLVLTPIPLAELMAAENSGPTTGTETYFPKEDFAFPGEELTTEENGSLDAADYQGIIVRYKTGPGDGFGVAGLTSSTDAAKAGGLELVTVESGDDAAEVLASLRQNPQVEYAEPNYVLKTQESDWEPNDPLYSSQWALPVLQAPAAWANALDLLAGGNADTSGNGNVEPEEREAALVSASPVTVAVIDTGVDTGHEDLVGRVLPGYDFVNDDDIPQDDSVSGHGTHVAGIIAAAADNDLGIAGAAGLLPVSILPVKVLSSSGNGTMLDVADGIKWAADNGATVINLSLGARLPDYPLTLAEAVQYAQGRGVIVVAAAGNEGESVDGFYPACMLGVIAVSATGQDHQTAKFSNYGWQTINAPGVDIDSTLPDNGYGQKSGTSMAAAFVSAAAALLQSVDSEVGSTQVGEAIRQGERQASQYWNGWSYTYLYVLSFYRAMQNLDDDLYYYDDLTWVEPLENTTHLSGDRVRLTVKASIPEHVGRVEFVLYPAVGDDKFILASIPSEDGITGGYYTLEWDSTSVPDGEYEIEISSYSIPVESEDYRLDRVYFSFIVANNMESGLAVVIKKPDGTAASGAPVAIVHQMEINDEVEYDQEIVWQGYADIEGQVIVPGAVATDGNDYLVMCRGTEPGFLYYRTVRAPALDVVMDATEASTVTVTGVRTDGLPLKDALILVDREDTSSIWDLSDLFRSIPLAVLDETGSAQFTLSKGRYDLRLISGSDTYYLVRDGLEVTDSATLLDFSPTPAEVVTLCLEPDGDYDEVSFLLRDAWSYDSIGFDYVSGDTVFTVSPGWYTADIKVSSCESIETGEYNRREWIWELSSTFELTATGAENSFFLPFGGPVRAELSLYDYEEGTYHPGSAVYLPTNFSDQYSNRTAGIWFREYAVAVSEADATSSRQIVRRSISFLGEENGLSDEVARTEERQIRRTVFDRAQMVFIPIDNAVIEVRPELEIIWLPGEGQQSVPVIGQYSWSIGAVYNLAWWYTRLEEPIGDYNALLSLEAGPFGPSETNGLADSAPLTLHLIEEIPDIEPEPDLTIEVLGLEGSPLPDARISVLVQEDGGFHQIEAYWDESFWYTNAEGLAFCEGLELEPDREYAVVVYQVPEEGAALYLAKSFQTGSDLEPQNIVLDASGNMHPVTFQVLDESNEAMSNIGLDYYLYRYDANDIPIGVWLEYRDEYEGPLDLTLWVSDGSYLVQACTPERWSADSSLYYLAKEFDISDELSIAQTNIVLGGAEMVPLQIGVPSVAGEGWNLTYDTGGLALFPQSAGNLPVTPVVYPRQYLDWDEDVSQKRCQTVLVTPGVYDAQTVLIFRHYDGEWNYWLTGELELDDDPVVWNVTNDFSAEVVMSGEAFQPGGYISTTHRINDSTGNRLVATATGLFGYQPSALGNSVESPSVQNHYEIAPFLVIDGPDGTEISRYKDAGPDYNRLSQWGDGFGYDSISTDVGTANYYDKPVMAFRFSENSTFFGGSYLIPGNAGSGSYLATLEFGTGPGGVIYCTPNAFEVVTVEREFQLIGLSGTVVRDLVFDPEDGKIIYAATSDGVYRSPNGGLSFSQLGSGLTGTSISRLVLVTLSNGQNVLLARGAGVGVQRYDLDQGSSGNWSRCDSEFGFSALGGSGGVVYGVIGRSEGDDRPSVYRSEDGGVTWVVAGLAGKSTVRVFAINAGTVYASGIDGSLWSSTDRGETWLPRTGKLGGVMVDYLVADPANPAKLYAGVLMTANGQGVCGYRSLDGGDSWQALSGLPLTRLRSLTVDPGNGNTLVAAGQDSQGNATIYKSFDGGNTWWDNGVGLPAKSVIYTVAISPEGPDQVFAGLSSGIYSTALISEPVINCQSPATGSEINAYYLTVAGTVEGVYQSLDASLYRTGYPATAVPIPGVNHSVQSGEFAFRVDLLDMGSQYTTPGVDYTLRLEVGYAGDRRAVREVGYRITVAYGPQVYLRPRVSLEGGAGRLIEADLVVRDIHDLCGLSLDLEFDPDGFEVVSTAEGKAFRGGSVFGSYNFGAYNETANAADNGAGTIQCAVVITGAADGVSTGEQEVVLGTIVFRAKGSGTMVFDLDPDYLAAKIAITPGKTVLVKLGDSGGGKIAYAGYDSLKYAACLLWDLNLDGRVGIVDLIQLAQRYGSRDSTCDGNGDGVIDLHDLAALAILIS